MLAASPGPSRFDREVNVSSLLAPPLSVVVAWATEEAPFRPQGSESKTCARMVWASGAAVSAEAALTTSAAAMIHNRVFMLFLLRGPYRVDRPIFRSPFRIAARPRRSSPR